ncbi:NAD(P)H-dependent oxidoreductase [Fusibacter paucivorans]|uniref:NAD(P)H-dependent oxidoreductase n=1 Tax=Fusibacter paucivorans TaxID=76009 RepID=A0ABS5PS84_9FIRM|nr:NAD(P)H-dependent oxidoreductase [Fusibacter paucivorans]MBS7527943.1 NAD(P)H-dependent oxidoreductase [Fusibacter paucivorans]
MIRAHKNVILINGSPKRTNVSMSGWLAAFAEQRLKGELLEVKLIRAQKSLLNDNMAHDFETLRDADALVFIFPLYVFCLPGLLMRYLEDFYDFLKTQYSDDESIDQRGIKIYAVVNAGFVEPEVNLEAVRVIRSFSEKIQANFRFGVLIGGGPMIPNTQNALFMKPTIRALDAAFLKIGEDIAGEGQSLPADLQISVNFPKKLYHFMGDHRWISSVKKNGLKKKDLYRRPYQTLR